MQRYTTTFGDRSSPVEQSYVMESSSHEAGDYGSPQVVQHTTTTTTYRQPDAGDQGKGFSPKRLF